MENSEAHAFGFSTVGTSRNRRSAVCPIPYQLLGARSLALVRGEQQGLVSTLEPCHVDRAA